MQKRTDPTYLMGRQYRDAGNLNARVALHARFSRNAVPWYRWLWDRYAFPPAARVLEAGCGPAGLWAANADRIPPDLEVVLTDLSPGMLDAAREALRDGEGRFTFQQADAQALPFPDASFDAAIANHMLYHVPDQPRTIRELRRVLRPGGRLYAATNGERHMAEVEDLIHEIGGTMSKGSEATDFTLENGEERLRRSFERVELHRYPDGLDVTEREPLVAYILSSLATGDFTAPRIERLRRSIDERIAAEGAVRITKDTGLFIAS